MMQQGKATFSARNVEILGSKYLDILSRRGIKENAKRWYVKRVEAFVRAAQGRKLLDQSADDLNYYLEE